MHDCLTGPDGSAPLNPSGADDRRPGNGSLEPGPEQIFSVDNEPRPITCQTPLESTIVAGEARVSGLLIRFGTFQRQNRSSLELSVTRVATEQTKSATIDTASLVDNAIVNFRFTAFDNAGGETFRVLLRSNAGPDNCVATFVDPRGTLETQLAYGDFILDDTRVLLPPDLIVQTVDTRSSGPPNRLTYALTHWWVDRFGLYVEGALTLATMARARRLRLSTADATGDLSFQALDQPSSYRFSGYLPCPPGDRITLLADTDLGTAWTRLVLPYEPIPRPPSPDLFLRFIGLVNSEKRSVLEVGSRQSSPYSVVNRGHFQPHVRFVGLDILPGKNTDIVGDAHYLTRYFPERSLGAAYSLTVLEHLLMPWRFAVELNRVLEMDAIVYHATHQTWPVHAAPNDFYRFSDEALKFIFGPDAGFEIVDSHMEHRIWLYPEERTSQAYLSTPLLPGYGNSQVLARKVRHLDATSALWDVGADRMTERSRAYPVCHGQ